MIDIDFLKNSKIITGNEYLDFQEKTFFIKMTDCIENLETSKDGEGNPVLTNFDDFRKNMKELIFKYTGIANLEIATTDIPNAWVDVGLYSPNNPLIGAQGADYIDLLGNLELSRDMSLYKWFTGNKGKIFKGWVDTSTGRLEGDFQDVPAQLTIGKGLFDIFTTTNSKLSKREKSEMTAAVILHELGHIFSNALFSYQSSYDSFILVAAVKCLSNVKDKPIKVSIINDTAKLLDIKNASKYSSDFELMDEVEIVATFSKMMNRRNTDRALSLGITNYDSEVYADIYAVRMGAGYELIKASYNFKPYTNISFVKAAASLCIPAILLNIASILTATSGGFLHGLIAQIAFSFNVALCGLLISFVIFNLYSNYTTHGPYETNYKRLRTMMQNLILELKSNTNLTSKQRNELISNIMEAEKLVAKTKGILEDTAWSRLMGWITSPSDFKYKQLEQYTAAVMNHNINLTNERLKDL